MRELYRILDDIRPDVLHLNSSKLGVLGSVIGRLAGIRTIVFTSHGWAFNESRPSWQKAIFYILYWITVGICTRTICVSHETLRQISVLPLIRHKLVMIYNGIRIPAFFEKRQAKTELSAAFPLLDGGKKWIGVLAELHPIKGHDVLLESLSRIRAQLGEYQVVCMGAGELRDSLESQTRRIGLEKQVFFTGFVSEASRYIPTFECVILPSRSEAMPLAVIETGFAGVPIIASRVGGIPELVTDGETGFLFERENAEELSEKISTVISLPHDQMEKITGSFREKLERECTVEHMVTETLSTYGSSK
jgi:glycosyltransferase involved in cell wall biosynthesis